jgi:alanine racemase
VALDARAEVVAWREGWLRDALGDRDAPVHVKLDTGMGRLGTRDPAEADAVAHAAGGRLAGLMTHFATADELGDAFFGEQLERFRAWALPWKERRPELVLHAANSAGTLRDAAAHFDMVRCGIAVYGMDPFGEDPAARDLAPALALRTYVAEVKPCAPGESCGYGRRFVADRHTRIGTLPIGYGDGVRRGLTNNAEVVIAGARYPLVGTVSMDNVTVDLGPGAGVEPGAPAALIGDGILAEDLARALGTINYEITCGITARVPRTYVR